VPGCHSPRAPASDRRQEAARTTKPSPLEATEIITDLSEAKAGLVTLASEVHLQGEIGG